MRTTTSPASISAARLAAGAAVAIAVTAALGGCARTTSTSARLGSTPTSTPVRTSTPPVPVSSPSPPKQWVLTPLARGRVPLDARIGHVYFTGYRGQSLVLAELGTNGRMYPIEKLVPGSNRDGMMLAPSPDGRKIAWVVGGQAFTANLDGSGRHRLPGSADSGCGSPAWSPDSKVLAYGIAGKDGRTRLYIVNADGSARRLLDPVGGCAPAWSSDLQRAR